jgi:hypothetical protein
VPRDSPAKSKWRKVGSSGSPATHSPIPALPSKRPPGSYDANSPVSDSQTPPSRAQHIPLSTIPSKGKARDKVNADIDSPSMIPAASEIEMLSLYMPNSQWETIESSPLRTPEHDSPERSRGAHQSSAGVPTSCVRNPNHGFERGDNTRRRDHPTLHANSSYSAESTSNERTSEESDSASDRHHPLATSAPGSVPSPLTTSMARHSYKQATNPVPSPAPHLPVSGSGPGIGELRRHIVVKDGAPVPFSVSHLTSSYQTVGLPRNRSATPVERDDVTSPAGSGGVVHMPHPSSSVPPPDAGHPAFTRHRRSSSSSSLRSMSDRKQPTPPSHQRVSSSSSSPLQQQMQLLGGRSPKECFVLWITN